MSIITTLHHPRQEILDVINSVILLGPGGYIIYSGPVIELYDWLHSVGFTPLPSWNIADYAVDVLSGFVLRDDSDYPSDVATLVNELSARWTDNSLSLHLESLKEIKCDPSRHWSVDSYEVSFLLSVWVCYNRQWKVSTQQDVFQHLKVLIKYAVVRAALSQCRFHLLRIMDTGIH